MPNEPTVFTIAAGPRKSLTWNFLRYNSDGNDWAVGVSIVSGPFRCEDHHFTFENLSGFARDLENSFRSKDGFVEIKDPLGPDLFRIDFRRPPEVEISGVCRSYEDFDQSLRWGFKTEPATLTAFIAYLKVRASEFDDSP